MQNYSLARTVKTFLREIILHTLTAKEKKSLKALKTCKSIFINAPQPVVSIHLIYP